ncbi:dehydrogenase [uncultured Prevotella sp.]|nr:dehydrogenase [uncultured Prevotella sp.]
MADNYLERHQLEYEKRKAEWLRKKKHLPNKIKKTSVNNHIK